MILNNIHDIKKELKKFKQYKCVVIICKYNGGKSSIANELIHKYFGEQNTYYATFIDQSKSNFTPRKSRLQFGEIIKNKIVVFDELDDELGRDVRDYAKQLIKNNLVIILSNPYASTNNAEKEISTFKKFENKILPDNMLFIFVKN